MVILLPQPIGKDIGTMISSVCSEYFQPPMPLESMYPPFSPRPKYGDPEVCVAPYHPLADAMVQDHRRAYPVSCDSIFYPGGSAYL